MRASFLLLKWVGKALLNAATFGVAGDLIVDVLPDVAEDVWAWWTRDRDERQRREEMQAVAQAAAGEVLLEVEGIVAEIASDRPAEVRQALATYLTQVPPMLRRSLRRPSDPAGTTVPPDLAPRGADDLLLFLPAKLPRFRPGDRPLPGVDWELEQLLGVGGFGEVWRARNPFLESARPVALKFCLDPASAKALRNEAAVLDRVMRQGRHSGIVPLQQTYLSAAAPCLQYEYVDGGDLAGFLQEWRRRTGGGLKPRPAAQAVARVTRAVAFAHRLSPPIVHRDLKPANVLVERLPGDKINLRVTDFGISGVAASQMIRETSRGTSRGQLLVSGLRGTYTPFYASPQQMRGEPPDPRDDVFALGVIWYQLLTGELGVGRPGGSRWHRRLSEQGVTAPALDLLEACFEDNAADRPADAAVLAEGLAALVRPTPPSPAQAPAPAPPKAPEPHQWWEPSGPAVSRHQPTPPGTATPSPSPQPLWPAPAEMAALPKPGPTQKPRPAQVVPEAAEAHLLLPEAEEEIPTAEPLEPPPAAAEDLPTAEPLEEPPTAPAPDKWRATADEKVMQFWQDYYQCVLSKSSVLEMHKPGRKSRAACWVHFKLAGTLGGSLPSQMYLIHKLELGHVDLQIRKMGHRVAQLRERLGALLPPDMGLVQAAKSASIRIKVPVVDHRAAFGPQEGLAMQGIRAAEKLVTWAKEHSRQLEEALAAG